MNKQTLRVITKVEKLLLDLDLPANSPIFQKELRNAIAASECGLTPNQILKMVEERVELEGPRVWS